MLICLCLRCNHLLGTREARVIKEILRSHHRFGMQKKKQSAHTHFALETSISQVIVW